MAQGATFAILIMQRAAMQGLTSRFSFRPW
jgi:hypothetical protein